jgi:hypothetical protein
VTWIRIGKDLKLDPEQMSHQGLGQREILKEVKKERE